MTKQVEGTYPNWRNITEDVREFTGTIEVSDQAAEAISRIVPRLPGDDTPNHTVGLYTVSGRLYLRGSTKTRTAPPKSRCPVSRSAAIPPRCTSTASTCSRPSALGCVTSACRAFLKPLLQVMAVSLTIVMAVPKHMAKSQHYLCMSPHPSPRNLPNTTSSSKPTTSNPPSKNQNPLGWKHNQHQRQNPPWVDDKRKKKNYFQTRAKSRFASAIALPPPPWLFMFRQERGRGERSVSWVTGPKARAPWQRHHHPHLGFGGASPSSSSFLQPAARSAAGRRPPPPIASRRAEGTTTFIGFSRPRRSVFVSKEPIPNALRSQLSAIITLSARPPPPVLLRRRERRRARKQYPSAVKALPSTPTTAGALRLVEAVAEPAVAQRPESLIVHLPGGARVEVRDAGQAVLAAELLKALVPARSC